MIKLETPCLLLLLTACAAHPVWAQSEQQDLPLPAATNPYDLPQQDDDDDDDRNRPLERALAYDRRDFVEDLLLRATQLGTHDVPKLSQELSIPQRHAALAIEAAQAQVDVSNMNELLLRGLPPTFQVPSDLEVLHSASAEKLREMGLSEQQAREFVRWRRSARRISIHSSEVKTVRELKIKGEAATAEIARKIMRGNGVQRVQAIAQILGLVAPEATEARTQERLQEQRARDHRQAMEPMRPDPLAEFRRADGTLNWKEFAKSETLRGAGGIVHFAFALFLKELTVVLSTGDASRLDEFLSGLMDTDFYINYGLFAIGARTADGMYGQYVRRLSKKRFMNSVMRSNLVLAAGLAVPMIVRGNFDMGTYVVDVAALGLSATAVKAALEGTKGVWRLVSKGKTLRLGKLATPAGWVYTAAETAVVLLIGDVVANKIDSYLDERHLRSAIKDAQADLWKVVQAIESGEDVAPGEVEAAVLAVESAYDKLRAHQTDPLKGRLAKFQQEMDAIARLALRGEVKAEAMERALESQPALRAFFANRYGTAEAYVDSLRASSSGQAERSLGEQNDRFAGDWDALIKDVYVGSSGADDPLPAEGSRLATYDDQTEALLRVLDSTTDPEAREHIALAIARVRLGRAMDQNVYQSSRSGGASEPAPADDQSGLTQALPGGN